RGPFVAGLYTRKTKVNPSIAAKFASDISDVIFGANGGMARMEYVGMGFTYVRAEVYQAIQDRFELKEVAGGYHGKSVVPYFLPYLADEGRDCLCYLAEDYAFSHRAKLAGYPPMADTMIDLGHIGKYTYSVRDLVSPDADLLAQKQAIIEEQDLEYTKL